ncbi:MAG: SAM-dependent methyltransferase [Gammaproteobacteria bacterium CG11_big_fil_rev_8_21_14_0_20_46_22]|nr:MAG: SAM-dependent methyltransferase [Gammaproteobacteria bacterium CG12_big_fil_rev_8_21_14_0_65_46_12]PIR10946.1 MAG: SAM-dependent methyltransferase [Gammaproteobacteria bacterium CG11_big_fil_rev_8_21_14_0_20_46_22]
MSAMSTQNHLLPDGLQGYLEAHMTPLDPILLELHAETASLPKGQMQSSMDLAAFLQMLIKLSGAQRVLELGTFTGFSTLAMAMALPVNGEIITCDIDTEMPDFGRPFWEKAGMANKITCLEGEAGASLLQLKQDQQRFDLCFIDANKSKYLYYAEACFDLLPRGGVLLLDNTLWKGEVISQAKPNTLLKNILACNTALAQHPGLKTVILPIGDGLTFAIKEV